jgi:hypothetical protein
VKYKIAVLTKKVREGIKGYGQWVKGYGLRVMRLED